MKEVIKPSDPRAKKFEEPIQKEIEGLLKRKTWKIVCRSEIPEDGNLSKARFIFAIKDEGTDKKYGKDLIGA